MRKNNTVLDPENIMFLDAQKKKRTKDQMLMGKVAQIANTPPTANLEKYHAESD